jgi:hypothetical protein
VPAHLHWPGRPSATCAICGGAEPPGSLGGSFHSASKLGATKFCDLSCGPGAAPRTSAGLVNCPAAPPPCKPSPATGQFICRPGIRQHRRRRMARITMQLESSGCASTLSPAGQKGPAFYLSFKFRERIAMSCVFAQWRAAGVCADTRVPPRIRKEFDAEETAYCPWNLLTELPILPMKVACSSEPRIGSI